MAQVVVVDDDAVISTLLSLSLATGGHEVTTFDSGEALLDELGARRFDLILLDLHMSGIDGLDCLQRIKERHMAPSTKIIMLTGSEDDEDVARAHRLGASGYLVKPFHAERLVEQLADALGRTGLVWMDDMHRIIDRGAARPAVRPFARRS